MTQPALDRRQRHTGIHPPTSGFTPQIMKMQIDLLSRGPTLRTQVHRRLVVGRLHPVHESTLATVTVHHDPDLLALKPARADDADPTVARARDLLLRLQKELLAGVDALEAIVILWVALAFIALRRPD